MFAHFAFPRFLSFVLCMALLSCGQSGPQISPAPPSADSAIKARLVPPTPPESFDRQAALAEIQAAACPDSVDPAVWRQLASSLAAALAAEAEPRTASERPTGVDNQLLDLTIVDDGMGGQRIEWSYVNTGDCDLNSEVNISDLTPIGMHFGDDAASGDWAAAKFADCDRNGEVNISDVTPIGMHYGSSCVRYCVYGRNGDSGGYTYVDEVPLSEAQGDPPTHFSWPIPQPAYEHYIVAACDAFGDDRPGLPVPNSSALVLEAAGLSIDSISGQSVTLSGDAAALAPGQVLVSTDGHGLIGRVETVTPQAGGAVVETTPATLEELFDYADANIARRLTYDMLESFEPAVEGLKLTPSAWSGTSATSADKQSDMTLAAFRVEFPDKDFIYGLQVKGALEFKLDTELDLQVGEGWPSFGELQYFDFSTDVEVLGEVEVKWATKTEFVKSNYLLGTLHFTPTIVFVGPIPLVLTPEVALYCGFEGSVEVGLMFKPFIKLSVGAGLRYTKDGGWDPYYDADYDYGIGLTEPNLYGKIEFSGNIFSPQPTFELYGVAGPYAKFDLPLVKVEGQIQSTPPEFSLTVSLGAKGSVGAKVDVLGRQLMDYESGTLFEVLVKVYEEKWPLIQHPLTFDVEWEGSWPGVLISQYDYDKPYLYVHKPGVGSWWLGYFQNGDLEAQPFALWTDQTDYDAAGQADSGSFRFIVSKLEPGSYSVGLDAPVLSHSAIRVTKITCSGAASGSYEMENGAPTANRSWTGITYDSVNDVVTVIDESHALPPPY